MSLHISQHIVVRPMICVTMILVLIGIHVIASQTNVSAFFQLFIQSVICVYLGCFLAAKIKKSDIQGENNHKRLQKDDDQETMSSKDAYMFPVYGSMVLFSLYVAYKFLPTTWLDIAFTAHFSFIGLFCLAGFLELPVSKFAPKHWTNVIVIDRVFHLNLIFKKIDLPIKLNYLEAFCLAISIFPCFLYVKTKNWITNNIFGIAFSVVGIENLNLPNFKTGFILLWGLFFYDIFWVYGTDVMVTVAKSFNVPIKLVFPYDWDLDGEFAPQPKFSMLGLGDIVIPGIFVALCLKFDLDKYLKQAKNIHSVKTPLFNWCFGGYILGIITTYVVMVVFKHAQPALLFLVPGCTGAVMIKALISKEFKEIFSYEEEHGREKKPQIEEDKKAEENQKLTQESTPESDKKEQ